MWSVDHPSIGLNVLLERKKKRKNELEIFDGQ